MKRKLDHAHDSAEQFAVAVLGWVAEDEDRLLGFLQAGGLSPDTFRESARDPGFLCAILDYVMADDEALIACAASLGVRPERIAAAWRTLQTPDFDHTL